MKTMLKMLKDFYIQRIIVYSVIVFFSLFVIVPLGDLRMRFTDGHCSRCILYSDVIYNITNPKIHYFKIRFGNQEICEYSMAVTVVFCLLYSAVVGCLYYFLYRKDNAETQQENKLDLAHFLFLVHILVEFAVIIVMLVSACMISAGFQHLCHSLTSGHGSISSCKDGQSFADWSVFDGSNFFISLSVATAGSWFLFVSWLLQGVLGVLKLRTLNFLPITFFRSCCRR